ncbi:MAG: cytochrome b N-terminal domain-containing protein [Pirellulales bacterium]|nr:cytochrome b N-terminal domain-containing protein [Pirellulales bacterium]
MKALFRWIEDRSGCSAVLRGCLESPVPGGARWSRVWPCAILFSFCVQAVTGFFLWTFYSPSAQTAWESVYFVQHEVVGGWLLRAVHHYSAQVLLVLIGVYLIQLIVTWRYRAPRELVFWVAVLMGLFTLGLMLTGDLLAWDQNSYAATQVRVSFLTLIPGIGGGLFKLAAGGPAFGHLTLTRFLALHIGLFSAIFAVLLVLHGLLLRRTDAAEAAAGGKAAPFWPQQALRNAVANLAVLVVVLLLALQHGMSGDHAGVALGAPADPDPSSFYAAARPEWAFLGLYEFSNLFPGELKIVPIFLVPGLLVCVVFLMPFIGRSPAGHWFNVGFTAVILIGIVALSFRSLAHDRANKEHQAALAEGHQQAERVRQLARAPSGIPATGALTLLRNDPKTQGPILFKTHCASCHDYLDAEGQGIAAEESSAPNLHAYGSRQWLSGLLDPKRITSPQYFGNTKFRKGDMAAFVRDSLNDLDDEEKTDLQKAIAALSAEARLRSQQEVDAKQSSQIAEGRDMLDDFFGCTGCHRFHDKGQLGSAPDLTGYASGEWLMGIIGNPAHKRFYGDENDRMPAYAEFPDEPAKNQLTEQQLGLLVDWLRGEWYDE